MDVTPSQFGLLQQLMSASHLRHEVISQNIANVNTPGFHRQDVRFDEALLAALRDGDSVGTNLRPEIYEVEGLPERVDGNNVDIDKEMGQLSKNALLYQTWTQILASKLSMMQSAINGR